MRWRKASGVLIHFLSVKIKIVEIQYFLIFLHYSSLSLSLSLISSLTYFSHCLIAAKSPLYFLLIVIFLCILPLCFFLCFFPLSLSLFLSFSFTQTQTHTHTHSHTFYHIYNSEHKMTSLHWGWKDEWAKKNLFYPVYFLQTKMTWAKNILIYKKSNQHFPSYFKSKSCSQFLQHFMSCLCSNILWTKNCKARL